MSRKAVKVNQLQSMHASCPKASDFFDSHAPYVEGLSTSLLLVGVSTQRSVTSLSADSSTHQATVHDSITGPPVCDASTEATVSASNVHSTHSNLYEVSWLALGDPGVPRQRALSDRRRAPKSQDPKAG